MSCCSIFRILALLILIMSVWWVLYHTYYIKEKTKAKGKVCLRLYTSKWRVHIQVVKLHGL